MSRIPKAEKNKNRVNEIPKPKLNISESGISFSFEALDTNEFFNLDGTCVNWANELFAMMKIVSSIKKEVLLSGKFSNSTFRIHNHENASPPIPLPEGVALRDFYQIRLSKSKGGIHGVFCGDVFYVIWLDPLHNMYPNKNYGGLKKVKPGSTCCKDREEIIDKLLEENDRLKNENNELEALINKS